MMQPKATWVDTQVGDFNGDGKADYISRDLGTGTWWTGISTGSSFTTSLWLRPVLTKEVFAFPDALAEVSCLKCAACAYWICMDYRIELDDNPEIDLNPE